MVIFTIQLHPTKLELLLFTGYPVDKMSKICYSEDVLAIVPSGNKA